MFLNRTGLNNALDGGLTGLIRDGYLITIDITKNRTEADLTDQETEKRRIEWKRPDSKPLTGILKKYRDSVSSSPKGCITV